MGVDSLDGPVLVLGATGMLGHKVLQRLGAAGVPAVGTVRGDAGRYAGHAVLGGMELVGGVDVDDFDTLLGALGAVRPGVVVNAVGLVKQLPGSKDPIPAIRTNSLLPHRLALASRAAGARLVHVSTDCVFSGRRGMSTERDVPDAEDLYGRSKLLGEVSGEGAVTLRTSIVGRQLSGSTGLFEWFLSNGVVGRGGDGSGGERPGRVKGFAGAVYSGVTTSVLGDVIAMLVREHAGLGEVWRGGVWQVASEPINKFDLLVMLNEAMGLGIEIERDEAFVCDRSLDGSAFCAATGWRCPSWRAMIGAVAGDATPYAAVRGERPVSV